MPSSGAAARPSSPCGSPPSLSRWTRAGRDDLGRPFAPGDVMILLRQRGALFEAIVKALKDADVPVTGRDRLTLADHPAVEDLLVLGPHPAAAR